MFPMATSASLGWGWRLLGLKHPMSHTSQGASHLPQNPWEDGEGLSDNRTWVWISPARARVVWGAREAPQVTRVGVQHVLPQVRLGYLSSNSENWKQIYLMWLHWEDGKTPPHLPAYLWF